MQTWCEHCVYPLNVAYFAQFLVHAEWLEHWRHQDWDWGTVEKLVSHVAKNIHLLIKHKFLKPFSLFLFFNLQLFLSKPVFLVVLQISQLVDCFLFFHSR